MPFWKETHSSKAAEAVRFAENTMDMPARLLDFFLTYLVIFKIIQPIRLVSVPVPAKIMQLQ